MIPIGDTQLYSPNGEGEKCGLVSALSLFEELSNNGHISSSEGGKDIES